MDKYRIGFQQRDRQDAQNLNNDTFCTLPVTRAQCIIGTERYPDYDDVDYTQGYSQIKETFGPLTKNDIPQP